MISGVPSQPTQTENKCQTKEITLLLEIIRPQMEILF